MNEKLNRIASNAQLTNAGNSGTAEILECAKCHASVSEDSDNCPQCGELLVYHVEVTSIPKTIGILCFGFLGVLFALTGIGLMFMDGNTRIPGAVLLVVAVMFLLKSLRCHKASIKWVRERRVQ